MGRASATRRRRERATTLDALRERLLERNYINNLLATIEREGSGSRPSAGALSAES